METQCVRIPLCAGETERFLDWIRSIQNRKTEMLEAMRAEGVSFEFIFLEKSDGGDSVVFYMQAGSLADARAPGRLRAAAGPQRASKSPSLVNTMVTLCA